MSVGRGAVNAAGRAPADGSGAELRQDRGHRAVHTVFQLRAECVHKSEEA